MHSLGAASTIAVLLAAVLAGLGLLFLLSPSRAFALSGHHPDALSAVMGGRYVGLAALIFGLIWLGNTKSLALAFFIGSGFGFLDAFLTVKVGGKAITHILAGIVSLALALHFGLAG